MNQEASIIMSGFKEKAAYFENIFSNLDTESDDEDNTPKQPKKDDTPCQPVRPEQGPPSEASFIELSSSPDTQIDISSSPDQDHIVISSSPEVDRVDIASSPELEVYGTPLPEPEEDTQPGQAPIYLDSDSDAQDTDYSFKDSVKESSDTNNIITLKFQDGNRKHMRELQVKIDMPLTKPKEDYAKEFNLDITTMKLYFDGDLISDQDTAAQLDIEDGCVIDVVLPQTITYVPPPSPVDLTSPTKPSPRGRVPMRGRGGRRGRARGKRR